MLHSIISNQQYYGGTVISDSMVLRDRGIIVIKDACC